MYIPPHFQLNDRALAHSVIQDYAFGQLITVDSDGLPFTTHLPFLLNEDEGEHGTLVGHMARANPQWRHFDNGLPVLALFAGPHAYVSPSWYQPGPAVPTWNYVAVHAYGTPRLMEDADEAMALLERLVDTFEAALSSPWKLPTDDKTVRAMLRGIVPFELPISRLEAKAKLNQNRPAADQAGVAAGLRQTSHPDSIAVAEWMERNLANN
jgi:transcriptional regulator